MLRRSVSIVLTLFATLVISGIGPAGAASRANAVNPRSLALPADAFAPGTAGKGQVDPNSNNKSTKYWPRSEHAVAYAWFGRVTGYYQKGKWTPPGSKDTVSFLYDASIFKKAKGALGSWHDASGFPLSDPKVFPRSCASTLTAPCSRVELHFTDGYYGYDDAVLAGLCLIETRAVAKKATFQAQLGQLTTILDSVDRVAFARASAVCAPAT